MESLPPVVSLFRHESMAVVRIQDLAYSQIVPLLVGALPPEVRSLMLVTPSDTRMFEITSQGVSYADTEGVGRDKQSNIRVPGEVEPGDGESFEADPQEEAARLAAESNHDQAAEDVTDVTAEIASADTPAARARAMRDLRRAETPPASDPCGRCGGSGQIQIAMPDGGATTGPCGVCRGSGVIRRFGVRR